MTPVRSELFVPDRGLQLRMVAAAVLTPLSVLAAVAAVALLLPVKVVGGIALAAVIGIVAAVRARRRVEHARVVGPGEEPGLHAIVERLCVRLDIAKPEIVVDDEAQPNSWILDLPGRGPRLHLTTGLLDVLDPGEIEAVIAHELCHVAHGDATVMTVVGMPGAVLRDGSAGANLGWWPLMLGSIVAWCIGALASLGTNTLSRYRELAADAGAAALTGRPSALASALMKVAAESTRLPKEDLRIAAARNAFNLLPVHVTEDEDDDWLERAFVRSTEHGALRRFAATHPSVDRRIAALHRAEERLQHARPAPARDL